MKRTICNCLCSLILMLPVTVWGKTNIIGYRTADNIEYSRFVIDVSDKARYSVLLLKNPNRLVVDIHDGAWIAEPAQCFPASSIVKKVRHAQKDGKTLRVVLDLVQSVAIKKSFQIEPRDGKSFRIVVDMLPGAPFSVPEPAESSQQDPVPESQTKTAEPAPEPPIPEPSMPTPVMIYPQEKLVSQKLPASSGLATPVPDVPMTSTPVQKSLPSVPTKEAVKKPVTVMQKPLIILDPGHGGDDPGTIGRIFKTYEKEVTFKIALLLKKQLEKTGRYRVEMTRSGDYFVRLQDRVNKAQEKQANIFISLHADSHPQPNMRGLSVYTLSETASDKEAEALAAKENKSDVIKGVDLKGQTSEVATILIDLIQRETKNNSAVFAETAVSELKKTVTVLPNAHRFAGFKVLKGIDVAAVLIELGYLSNKEEEVLLISRPYQKKIVSALITAIDKHFSAQKLEKP